MLKSVSTLNFEYYTSVVVSLRSCGVVATAFLEFWKRREAVHQYDWDIRPSDDPERVRPQYEIKITYRKLNPVTQVRRLLYSFISNMINRFHIIVVCVLYDAYHTHMVHFGVQCMSQVYL